MKTIFKWLFRLAATVVLAAIALVLARNVILRETIEWQVFSRTGMDARIGYLDLGLLTPVLRIEDVKIYYPPDVGGVTLMEIPEFYLDYDFNALWWRRCVRIPRARLNISEVNVLEGQFRLPSPRAPEPAASSPAGSGSGSSLVFGGIDQLELSLGVVKFSSQRSGSGTREVAVNLKNYPVKNVKSAGDLTWQLLPVLLGKGVLSGPQ